MGENMQKLNLFQRAEGGVGVFFIDLGAPLKKLITASALYCTFSKSTLYRGKMKNIIGYLGTTKGPSVAPNSPYPPNVAQGCIRVSKG